MYAPFSYSWAFQVQMYECLCRSKRSYVFCAWLRLRTFYICIFLEEKNGKIQMSGI